jgi:predicted DNA-binding WGR domain protein
MNFKFIGHYYDSIENHDKVWGVIFLEKPTLSLWDSSTGAKCVSFWGRRGKKLQTKIVIDDRDLQKLVQAKEKKGYQEVDSKKLGEVYPEFERDLSKTAMWAMLKL